MKHFLLAVLVVLACSTTFANALNFDEFKVLTLLPRGIVRIPDLFDTPRPVEYVLDDFRVKLVKVGDSQETGLVPDGPVEVHIMDNNGRIWVRSGQDEQINHNTLVNIPFTEELLASPRSRITLTKGNGDGYVISWKGPGVEDRLSFYHYVDADLLSIKTNFLPEALFQFQDPQDVLTPEPTPAPTRKPTFALPESFAVKYGDVYEIRSSKNMWIYVTDLSNPLTYANLFFGSVRNPYRIRFIDPRDHSNTSNMRASDPCLIEDISGRYWTRIDGSDELITTYRNSDLASMQTWQIDGLGFRDEGEIVEGPLFGLYQKDNRIDKTWLALSSNTRFEDQMGLERLLNVETEGHLDVGPSGYQLFPSELGFPNTPPTQQPTQSSPMISPTKQPTPGSPMVSPTKQPTPGSPMVSPTKQPTTLSPTIEGETNGPVYTAGPTDPNLGCQYLVGNGGCQDPQGRYRASPSEVFTMCGYGDVPCDTREACWDLCARFRLYQEDTCTGFSFSKSDQTCEIISGPIDPLHIFVPNNKPENYEEVCFLCYNALTATSPPVATGTAAPTGGSEPKCNYLKESGACVSPGTTVANQGVPFICDSIDGKCTPEECGEACIFKEGKCYGFLTNPKEGTCHLMETPIDAEEVAPDPNAGFCAICAEEPDVEVVTDETSSASRNTMAKAFMFATSMAWLYI